MTDLVKVELVSTEFDKTVGEEITKWLNGKISGERCAKTLVDKAGDTLPVAGALGGMFGGGAVGAAIGVVLGVVLGRILVLLLGLLGAAVGGLGGQALNRKIKFLRYSSRK